MRLAPILVSFFCLLAMKMCAAQIGRNLMREAIDSRRIIDQNSWRVAQPPPQMEKNVVAQFIIDVAAFTARGHRSNNKFA